jgi:O-antigen/teichoic acid export membrane protein
VRVVATDDGSKNHGPVAAAGGSGVIVRRLFAVALHPLSREHALILLEQAIVIVGGFLTAFLIVRWSDAAQLGLYALGLSLIMALLGFHESLVVEPYLVGRFCPRESPAEEAGVALAFTALFAATGVVILAIVALAVLGWAGIPERAALIWALAGVLPFALLRDAARGFAGAQSNTGGRVFLDLAAAFVQLLALGWLAASGQMSALGAYAALAAGSALPTAVWLYRSRARFTIRLRDMRAALKQTWVLGKWLLVGRTIQLHSYVIYWLAAAIAGVAVTGVYAACVSIVGFANLLMVGPIRAFLPVSVSAWKRDGGAGLWRAAIRSTAVIAIAMAGFSLAILFGGEPVMRLLFHGEEFEGQNQALIVLALAVCSGNLGAPASIALTTMKRPRAIIVITSAEAFLTVALAWELMAQRGLIGAAYGILVGSVAGAIGRWVAFYMTAPKVIDAAPVLHAMQEFAGYHDDRRWTATRMSGQEDAEVFAVSATGPPPTWNMHDTVVVKLIKLATTSPVDVRQAQDHLHAALDQREVNGWRISVPRSLYVCESPPALIMTNVPGKPISSYASRRGVLPTSVVLEAACTFVAAMERYWSSGRRHGDLNLGNVLLEPETKRMSIIDAGTRADCRICSDITRFRSAAACDLAHLLWEVAHDLSDLVRDMGRSQTMRLADEMFAESILYAAVNRLESQEKKRRLLAEIWIYAQQHLDDKLDLPWSVRNASNRIVNQVIKYVARRRMRSLLERVSAYADAGAMESGENARPATYHAVQR